MAFLGALFHGIEFISASEFLGVQLGSATEGQRADASRAQVAIINRGSLRLAHCASGIIGPLAYVTYVSSYVCHRRIGSNSTTEYMPMKSRG